MAKVKELSIFFPFWNEEKNIEKVVLSAIPVAQRTATKWEILMVDDGSSDKTLLKANALARSNKNLRVVSHSPNRGYGASLREGFANAKYDLVVFTDGDGQFDISELERFISQLPGNDMVIGYRKKRIDHPFRHLLMNLLKVWDYVFFGFSYKDIDCGFKLFTKKAIDQIQPLNSEGAMITTEILAKARRKKLKIAEVEVSHFKRIFGDQSGGNIRVILRAVRESLSLWLSLNFNLWKK